MQFQHQAGAVQGVQVIPHWPIVSWHQEKLVMWIPFLGGCLTAGSELLPCLLVCKLRSARIWSSHFFKAIVSVRCGDFCEQWHPSTLSLAQKLNHCTRVNNQPLLPCSKSFCWRTVAEITLFLLVKAAFFISLISKSTLAFYWNRVMLWKLFPGIFVFSVVSISVFFPSMYRIPS